ncbi:chromate reductase [Rhodobacter aestuarii]|uniref:Chromate reductase n=1 Tax=Rhodobacter aestuarii TaxID=453582 RepID=A0A1N7M0I9_9RHOB|nr:NAD(P)H-dependent oxidoreductase [Rhodobacter aestuarii]PTV94761.1 chromate reductase [Rhodobacter aestuarii]SIS79606.1 chromate reductase [Rhodobacter aestuarii]
MSQTFEIAVLVGSLRKGALTRTLANALTKLAPENLRFTFIEIGDLPLYNPDLDTETPPAAWVRLRNEITQADGVMFVTPEYNRALPAALKNALDVGSRPYGSNVWGGKPGLVVSGSGGALGGYGANHHLRDTLVVLDVPTLSQPEAYVGHLGTLFDQTGAPNTDETKAYLSKIMTAYAAWVGKLAA